MLHVKLVMEVQILTALLVYQSEKFSSMENARNAMTHVLLAEEVDLTDSVGLVTMVFSLTLLNIYAIINVLKLICSNHILLVLAQPWLLHLTAKIVTKCVWSARVQLIVIAPFATVDSGLKGRLQESNTILTVSSLRARQE